MIVNPLCKLHRNRSLEGGIRRIFVAAVDIELNAGESREIIMLRRMSDHWPASYYSCRSEPPIDKDTGNPAEYDHRGEITDDNSNKFTTYNRNPAATAMHPKSLVGVKKHVMSGEKSLQILNLP